MSPILECFTVGTLATFTGCDDDAGPTTWAAIRLKWGLAVCADTLPALSDPHEIRAWMASGPHTWVLVDSEDLSWCFAKWAFGDGEPVPCVDPTSFIAGVGGEQLLLLSTAACALAGRLYPAWAACVQMAVDVEVVAVFPVQGGMEA